MSKAITPQRLAWDILLMAADGGMPDTFWQTDQRIQRACRVLQWTPERARSWAHARKAEAGQRHDLRRKTDAPDPRAQDGDALYRQTNLQLDQLASRIEVRDGD